MVLKPDVPSNCCIREERSRKIALIRKLLGNQTGELQIGTIDSFFMKILQVLAPELGIWGDVSMIDENDDRLAMQRKMHQMMIEATQKYFDAGKMYDDDLQVSYFSSIYGVKEEKCNAYVEDLERACSI